MPQKITDTELLARVDAELHQAQDYMGGKLSVQRRHALQYYLAQAEGELAPPEVEGRSTIVSTDVADAVEWMLPSLLRIFTASDRVVTLAPRKPGKEEMAGDATDYLNWLFYTQNDGFQSLHTMFKDALLSKMGVLKVYWDDRVEEAREEYVGLTDWEVASLLKDKEVEPIEHEARPDPDDQEKRRQALQQIYDQARQVQQQAQNLPINTPQAQQAIQVLQQLQAAQQGIEAQPPVMLHDVTVRRTKSGGKVRIEPVPPEEFFISRAAKKISETPFCAHVRETTVSDLRADGYSIGDDELPADDAGMVGRSMERTERWSYDDSTAPYPNMSEAVGDPSMRRIWVVEAYLKADVDGDGIAEWRRVLKCGQKILDNCECEGPPFVSITPIPMPHRFFGLSVADLAMPIQRRKTGLIRAADDNVYLTSNERYFAVEGQCNLDDLLTSRPGGVVRVKNPNAVGPLGRASSGMGDIYQLLEYTEQEKEQHIGFTRRSGGPGVNSIQKTALQAGIEVNRDDMRLELIARVFAEGGIKDLFVRMLQLVCRYQRQPAQFQLNDRWLEVNPREWRHLFDVSMNVGLGTNDPGLRAGQIGQIMGVQKELLPLGVVTPVELYNSASELTKILGYKNADQFFRNPANHPPPAPGPNPEQLKAQSAQQMQQAELQAKLQIEAAQKEHEVQLAQLRAQQEMQTEAHKQSLQHQQVQAQNEIEARRDQLQAQHQAQLDQLRIAADERIAQLREQNALEIARIDAMSRVQVAEISANTTITAAQIAASRATREVGNERRDAVVE